MGEVPLYTPRRLCKVTHFPVLWGVGYPTPPPKKHREVYGVDVSILKHMYKPCLYLSHFKTHCVTVYNGTTRSAWLLPTCPSLHPTPSS